MTAPQAVDILLAVIDYNTTRPKPHHKNVDLMTTALKLEINHG